jgi:hypothetical protein
MKKSLLLAIFLVINYCVFAQNELIVHQNEKGLYLEHPVVAKENFYSIGRLYNIAPKDIATFNGIDMAKGLNIGQLILIPLNPNNFTQKDNKGRPVYYVVGQKEGLYRVSIKNNNVLMADIRKWNKLPNDNISTGQKLIVGFLISPEADNIPEPAKPLAETEEPKKEADLPPVQEEKKEEPVKQPVEEKKIVQPQPRPVNNQLPAGNNSEGYFKSHFDQQVKKHPVKKDLTASAGIFKTASGWQDAKYYALIDGVEPGTIIKIINPTNSKVIYAKVLGEMSGIRQNQGYDVRISNAAASVLDVTDTDKFIVKVNY